jgi:hypothetical protein
LKDASDEVGWCWAKNTSPWEDNKVASPTPTTFLRAYVWVDVDGGPRFIWEDELLDRDVVHLVKDTEAPSTLQPSLNEGDLGWTIKFLPVAKIPEILQRAVVTYVSVNPAKKYLGWYLDGFTTQSSKTGIVEEDLDILDDAIDQWDSKKKSRLKSKSNGSKWRWAEVESVVFVWGM